MNERFRRFRAPIAIVAAAALFAAAAGGEPVEPKEPPSWLIENIISIVIIASMLLAFVIWGVIVHRRLAQRNAEEEKAALMLQAQIGALLAEHNRKTEPIGARAAGRGETLPPPAGVSVAPAGEKAAEPAARSAEKPDLAERVEAIVAKLRAGGLFSGFEGTLYLSDGESEAKIIRLSDGKTAVVMPQLDSAEFLARQLRRFDLCIVSLGSDEVCVLGSLGEYIADRLAP